jgi:hypothetical protein
LQENEGVINQNFLKRHPSQLARLLAEYSPRKAVMFVVIVERTKLVDMIRDVCNTTLLDYSLR